jgi:hypothetical protein
MVEKIEQRLRTSPYLLGNHDLDQLHPHAAEKNLVCGQILRDLGHSPEGAVRAAEWVAGKSGAWEFREIFDKL